MKLKKASFWSRSFAIFSDTLIFSLPTAILELGFGYKLGIFPMFTFYAYCILMEANFQTTLGKKFMGLKVVKINGSKPGLANCFWRNIAKAVSGLFYGYGFLRILAPHQIQTIHDELAGCVVVSKK